MSMFKGWLKTESKTKSKSTSTNVENPQNLINQERVSRIVHSEKRVAGAQTTASIFEQFIVVGVQTKNAKIAEPGILFKYPPTSNNIPDIVNFCFPNGVKMRYLKRTPSMSSLYELLCHQIDLSHSPNTFIFVLTTENREILYGICVRKDESVEHLPSFIKKEESVVDVATTTKPDAKKTTSNSINIAPRCYCFISRLPFFSLYLEILYGILGMEHVYQITQPYIHPSPSPDFFSDTDENVALLRKSVYEKTHKKSASASEIPTITTEENIPIPVPKEPLVSQIDIVSILQRFHKLEIPNPGQPLEFKLGPSKIVHFSRPVIDEEDEALKEWGLAILLHTLSKRNLFIMFNACILEKKVAVVSQNIRILSCVVLSILPLMKPFVYQSVVIPVLPLKMMSLLEAPVPFIVGITQMPDRIPSDVVLLNLDDGIVHLSQPVPEFPRFKHFEEFAAYYAELKRTWVKDEKPYVPTSKQLAFSKRIASIFAKSLLSMFDSFREHCITDMSQRNTPITVFIKESFLESVSPEHLPWFSGLLETQIFFHYVDNRLRKMDRKPT